MALQYSAARFLRAQARLYSNRFSRFMAFSIAFWVFMAFMAFMAAQQEEQQRLRQDGCSRPMDSILVVPIRGLSLSFRRAAVLPDFFLLMDFNDFRRLQPHRHVRLAYVFD